MKKTIFIGLSILSMLIVISYVIGILSKSQKQKINPKTIPIPTIDYQSYLNKKQVPLQSNKDKINRAEQKEFLSKSSFLSKDDINKLEKVKKNLPYYSDYFDADYSSLLNQIIVSKKNPQSQDQINKWLEKNQLLELADKTNLIIITDQSLEKYIANNEEIILNNNQKRIKTALDIKPTKETTIKPSPNLNLTPPVPNSPTPRYNTSLLSDIFNILDNHFTETSTPPSNLNSPSSVNPSINPPINIQTPSSSSSLTEIFDEVGTKVGLPPKILEAVMTIESPSTFKFSSNQIALYSTPGNSIPGCGPNVCSATGPMQITTGFDNQGLSSCPKCCSSKGCSNTRGSCPNQWSRYGQSITDYGPYSHTPNPCNIKDSLYAAAEKLKNDSQASDPTNWTQTQVYKASKQYHGSCSNNFRYARLGNRTYCEYVWWYYKNK